MHTPQTHRATEGNAEQILMRSLRYQPEQGFSAGEKLVSHTHTAEYEGQ